MFVLIFSFIQYSYLSFIFVSPVLSVSRTGRTYNTFPPYHTYEPKASGTGLLLPIYIYLERKENEEEKEKKAVKRYINVAVSLGYGEKKKGKKSHKLWAGVARTS